MAREARNLALAHPSASPPLRCPCGANTWNDPRRIDVYRGSRWRLRALISQRHWSGYGKACPRYAEHKAKPLLRDGLSVGACSNALYGCGGAAKGPINLKSRGGSATPDTPVADRRRRQNGVRCCFGEAGYYSPQPANRELKRAFGSPGFVLPNRR